MTLISGCLIWIEVRTFTTMAEIILDSVLYDILLGQFRMKGSKMLNREINRVIFIVINSTRWCTMAT